MAFYWSRHQEVTTAADASVTGTSWTEAQTIDLLADTPAGRYRIGWSYIWGTSSASYNFQARVQVDDTTTVMSHVEEPTFGVGLAAHPAVGFAYVDLTAGTHSIDLDFCASYATTVAYIGSRKLEIWRVDGAQEMPELLEDEEAGSISNADGDNYVNALQLAMPANTPAGTYRIGWSYAWALDNTSFYFDAQVQIDSTPVMIQLEPPKDAATSQKHINGGFVYVDLTATSHTIDLVFGPDTDGATAYIEQRRLEVWRVDTLTEIELLQEATETVNDDPGGTYDIIVESISLPVDTIAGTYRVEWNYCYGTSEGSSLTARVETKTYLDSVRIDDTYYDSIDYPTINNTNFRHPLSRFMYLRISGGAHILDVKTSAYSSSIPVIERIDQRRLALWRLPGRAGGYTIEWATTILTDIVSSPPVALDGPTTIYIALFSADPGPGGNDFTHELSGGAYARQAITFSAASDGVTSNSNLVTFPTASSDWLPPTHYAICTADTGGTQIYNDSLTRVQLVSTGEVLSFPIGYIDIDNNLDLVHSVGTEISDALLRSDSWTPGGLYLALFTADPGDSGSFTNEVTGGSYARQDISSASWVVTGTTVPPYTSNPSAITFPTATGDWGTITHAAICSAVSGGYQYMNNALSSPATIGVGDTLSFSIGEVYISILMNT